MQDVQMTPTALQRIKEIEEYFKEHDIETQFEEDAFKFLLQAFNVMREIAKIHSTYGPTVDEEFEERMSKPPTGEI